MVTDKQRETIVSMYRDGERIEDIMDATNVSRATVYYILRSRGVKTNRRTRTGDPTVSLQDVMAQLIDAERRATRYRVMLERCVTHDDCPLTAEIQVALADDRDSGTAVVVPSDSDSDEGLHPSSSS